MFGIGVCGSRRWVWCGRGVRCLLGVFGIGIGRVWWLETLWCLGVFGSGNVIDECVFVNGLLLCCEEDRDLRVGGREGGGEFLVCSILEVK